MKTSFTFLLALALVGTLPLPAHAASKPTCELTVKSSRGEASTKDSMTVFASEDETLTLRWESKNAKKAVDAEGDSVGLTGSTTVQTDGRDGFSYAFSNGSKKTRCSVSVRTYEASFDAATLTSSDEKPELAGEASGTKSVKIEIRDERGRKVYTSREARVRSGAWEARVAKKLKEGEYEVSLLGEKKYDLPLLATSTLVILPEGVSGGSLSVGALPLLMGGIATPGTSVPIAYIQVRNTGSSNAMIRGFDLVETGSASDDVVTGFSVSDDRGGSRASFETSFKKGVAYVPLPYVLAPGELRIFTIKAALRPSTQAYGNKELRINVLDADTTAKVSGAFPILGTAWVLR